MVIQIHEQYSCELNILAVQQKTMMLGFGEEDGHKDIINSMQ
jgi:hypothetical protein